MKWAEKMEWRGFLCKAEFKFFLFCCQREEILGSQNLSKVLVYHCCIKLPTQPWPKVVQAQISIKFRRKVLASRMCCIVYGIIHPYIAGLQSHKFYQLSVTERCGCGCGKNIQNAKVSRGNFSSLSDFRSAKLARLFRFQDLHVCEFQKYSMNIFCLSLSCYIKVRHNA